MSHSHETSDSGKSITFGLVLNGIYTIIEFGFGILTGSLALIADATHNLTDTVTLAVSFTANKLAKRKADAQKTFGYGRATILAALLNSFIMLGIAGFIAYEAFQRFQNPHPVEGGVVAAVALVGVAVNGSIAYMLSKHKKDLNMRSAFIDMLFDALSSLGAVAAGVIIMLTGAYGIDSIIALVIAALLTFNAAKILKEAIHILLEGSPSGIEVGDVTATIEGVKGVEGVDDLHLWSIRSGYIMLSCHVIVSTDNTKEGRRIVENIKERLERVHDITHATIEIEFEDTAKRESHESH